MHFKIHFLNEINFMEIMDLDLPLPVCLTQNDDGKPLPPPAHSPLLATV